MSGKKLYGFVIWLALAMPVSAQAEMVVIANAHSGIEKLSRDEVVNIFMGRYRKLPNGATAIPLDIDGESVERTYFYRQLLGKTLAEINAYWARLVFSGRTAAPEYIPTQREVIERVLRDTSAIGYVDKKSLNDKVRVVYEIAD